MARFSSQVRSSGEGLTRRELMKLSAAGVAAYASAAWIERLAADTATDPRRQRAVSTVPTDDPDLNKTVAARHRKGFRSGDRVIRPEIVSVYALKR